MDGVFMKKLLKLFCFSAAFLALLYAGSLFADKHTLRQDVIRFHVIADSDNQQDQEIKLDVRDAIIDFVQEDLDAMSDVQAVKAYLTENLTQLELVANNTLAKLGSTDRARVYLTEEAFGRREYDTFSLPSGIYDSLRIEIGDAQGRNWWCVIFPSLCTPTTQEAFADTAVAAGFNDDLTNTLSADTGYEIRFFFLDCLGKLENFFSFSS